MIITQNGGIFEHQSPSILKYRYSQMPFDCLRVLKTGDTRVIQAHYSCNSKNTCSKQSNVSPIEGQIIIT